MRAARLFIGGEQAAGLLSQTARVVCSLYGSLGATGKGHGSDTTVLLDLTGHEPDTPDVGLVPALLVQERETGADMKTKYKETARNGLAVNIVAC